MSASTPLYRPMSASSVFDARPCWEEGGVDAGDAVVWDDVGNPDDATGAAEATEHFAQLLVDACLKGTTEVSAKLVCTLCWWASAAGMGGLVKDLAMNPNAPSGHFARHMRFILGLDQLDENLYWLEVPGYKKAEACRTSLSLGVYPPHECLNREALVNPEATIDLHADAMADLPPICTEHPVFRASGGRARPYALYLDGVPFTKHDSMLGVFVYFTHTQVRHLSAVIRKSIVCKCGCRGWCTYHELFRFLHWSCKALAQGAFPDHRHDNQAWLESDNVRSGLAGLPMEVVGALIMIKGDWSTL